MWNYMGWDSASTLAAEVENPQRNYPRALALVAILTVSVYLVPLLAGLTLYPHQAGWSEWTVWPNLGKQAGGASLALAIAIAGLFAQWSLFNSNLLYASRIPHAMARDGWLPAVLSRTTARGAAPAATLCVLAAAAAALAVWPFEKLVVIDVLIYSAVLALEFAVLIRLRWKAPRTSRPFKVPGGWPGIAAVTVAPALCAGVLVFATFAPGADGAAADSGATAPVSSCAPPRGEPETHLQVGLLLAVVASGLGLYFLRRRKVRRSDE